MAKMTRITTVNGTVITINGGAPVKLLAIKGEAASTTVVTLQDTAGSPATLTALAAGAIPLAGQVDFHGVECPLGLPVAIAATGVALLVIWEPM